MKEKMVMFLLTIINQENDVEGGHGEGTEQGCYYKY